MAPASGTRRAALTASCRLHAGLTGEARNETRTTAVSADWLAGFGAGTSKSLVLSTTRLADNVEIDAATLTIRY